MGTLYIGMTWIFRIQSKHKRVFAKQSKPERWHQKSALLGILILLSESMGVLSMIPMTGQSLSFLQTWSFWDISNLRAPVSASWTSFPARYWALIRNDKNAAWLHLPQWMFPWPWAQQLPEMELALQGCTRDVWQWLLSTQGLSCCCTLIPSLLQSQKLICVSVQDPCPSHCVQSTGLNEAKAVGRSPPPTPALWRQKLYRHQILQSEDFHQQRWYQPYVLWGHFTSWKQNSRTQPYFSVEFGVRSFVPFSWEIEHLSHYKSVKRDRNWSLIQK